MNAAHDDYATVADALRWLSPDCDRETWIQIGMAVKAALGDDGFGLWDEWSQGADCYRPKDALAAWRSFKPGKVGPGTLFHHARVAGWNPQNGAIPHRPMPTHRPEAEAARRAAEEAAHTAAAGKAAAIWRRAPAAFAHPYLARKRIKGHGARLAFGKLAVPLFADPQTLVNLQFIDADGGKRFLKGGRKAGCFWWTGRSTPTLCIAEGFATAASIHEATGNRCFVAFDKGNLPAVALAVRGLCPGHALVVCADNDESGQGEYYGRMAAWQAGAAFAMPDAVGQDFNDMAGGW